MPATAALRSPELPAEELSLLCEDFGRFRDGYTGEEFECVAYRWSRALGLELCCVWEVFDWCFGGSSEFVLRRPGRRATYYAESIGVSQFLAGYDVDGNECARPDDDTLLARVAAIRGAAAGPLRRQSPGRLAVNDGGFNLAARRQRA